jgi:ADP-dependent NAD(P)H-hydrate dehydratase
MKQSITIDRNEALKHYKPVLNDTHKGIQGHALIIAGSYGKIGAAVLTSKSCLKAGCGLVTAFVPQCGYSVLQISNLEVMTLTDEQDNYITDIRFDFQPQAIALGPGLGQSEQTQKAVGEFLITNNIPLVIDADALNILSNNKEWLSFLTPKTILTPHPKELERLVGKWNSEEEKFEKTVAFSKRYELIVVMKGAPTYIIYGDIIFKNTSGNAALATAGSGDVLTGMICSFLTQAYSPISATVLGVYLHGLAADIALPETGIQSFIASDIIKYLGKAFLSLEKK